MNNKRIRQFSTRIAVLLAALCLTTAVPAQTTAFTYQGKLTDAGNPANGNYDLQFKLFDTLAVGTGAQQGATLVRDPVVVSAGVFTVTLDFGASVFTGADRYLEIGVRPAGSANPYTVLAPRQPLTSTPYAIQTLKAASADALSSACVGCVTGAQIGSLPSNSGNYIQNTASPQASSNFNISGSGTVGGSLNVNGAFPNGFFLSNGTASLRGTIVGNSVLFGTTTNSPLTFSTNEGTNNGSLVLDTTGNIGINSVTPETKLTVRTFGSDYGITHTNGSIRLTTYLGGNGNGGYLGTRSNHPLYFFTNDSGPLMTVTTNGNVGIGTPVPSAKFFVQGEAANGVGIAATGNASQSLNKGGWVKAMVFVLANGTIARCYNGLTGASTGNCGFSVTYSSLHYIVDFGFQVSDRFASLTTSSSGVPIDTITARINRQFANNNQIAVYVWNTRNDDVPVSDFHLIVY